MKEENALKFRPGNRDAGSGGRCPMTRLKRSEARKEVKQDHV